MYSIKEYLKKIYQITAEFGLLDFYHNYQIRKYLGKGMIPWDNGYTYYRNNYIRKMITDNKIIDLFKNQRQLPPSYGVALDERCIEFPWIISQLCNGKNSLLDAGSALNNRYLLDHPIFRDKKISIMTLAPETNCYYQRSINYLYEDLRKIPFRNSTFDIITCISTLEHVGMNNFQYTHNTQFAEDRPSDIFVVINELKRVLRPGGTLLITVPFGKYENFKSFVQFDSKMISDLVNALNKDTVEKIIYYYHEDSWKLSNENEASSASYSSYSLKKGIIKEKDKAPAARSVCCLKYINDGKEI